MLQTSMTKLVLLILSIILVSILKLEDALVCYECSSDKLATCSNSDFLNDSLVIHCLFRPATCQKITLTMNSWRFNNECRAKDRIPRWRPTSRPIYKAKETRHINYCTAAIDHRLEIQQQVSHMCVGIRAADVTHTRRRCNYATDRQMCHFPRHKKTSKRRIFLSCDFCDTDLCNGY